MELLPPCGSDVHYVGRHRKYCVIYIPILTILLIYFILAAPDDYAPDDSGFWERSPSTETTVGTPAPSFISDSMDQSADFVIDLTQVKTYRYLDDLYVGAKIWLSNRHLRKSQP